MERLHLNQNVLKTD